MSDATPREQENLDRDLTKTKYDELKKRLARDQDLIHEASEKLKAADTDNNNANDTHIQMRINNLEKLVVVTGASLALSFSGISTIKASSHPVHYHHLISIAWGLFVGGIVFALTSNWLAVLSMEYKHRLRNYYAMQHPIRLLQTVLSDPEQQFEVRMKEGEQHLKSWHRIEASSVRIAWLAQCSIVAGFLVFCIFFTGNMSQ